MKKLEDIEKKDIFKTPEGYFDLLPSIIQNRVATKEEVRGIPFLIAGLKYALPVIVITISLLWFIKPAPASPEEILASIDTKDIADYLTDMEINNDDLLNLLDYSIINTDSLNLQESHIIIDETDLTDLWIELETEI